MNLASKIPLGVWPNVYIYIGMPTKNAIAVIEALIMGYK